MLKVLSYILCDLDTKVKVIGQKAGICGGVPSTSALVCLYDLILYVPVNNLSVTSGQVFLGSTSAKQGLMCLTQGHNAVTPVRLEPAALRS